MNATTFTIYREYLEKTGDPSAAASLTLADTLRSSLDAKAAPPAGAVLNIKQAATYLGYSSDGLRKIVNRTRRIQAGQHTLGPTVEFSQSGKYGVLLFRREWLDRFIEENRVRPDNSTLPMPRKGPGRTDKADEWQRQVVYREQWI